MKEDDLKIKMDLKIILNEEGIKKHTKSWYVANNIIGFRCLKNAGMILIEIEDPERIVPYKTMTFHKEEVKKVEVIL